MFTERIRKGLSYALATFLLASVVAWAYVRIAKGEAPALPTTPEGSIIIPPEMIQQFEASAGEPLGKLSEDAKAWTARQQTLEPFFIQLRMNTLAAAKIPANQYDRWRLDTEKKVIYKLTDAQYDLFKKQLQQQRGQ